MDLSKLMSRAVKKGKHRKQVKTDDIDPDFFITKPENKRDGSSEV